MRRSSSCTFDPPPSKLHHSDYPSLLADRQCSVITKWRFSAPAWRFLPVISIFPSPGPASICQIRLELRTAGVSQPSAGLIIKTTTHHFAPYGYGNTTAHSLFALLQTMDPVNTNKPANPRVSDMDSQASLSDQSDRVRHGRQKLCLVHRVS
ncbi:hypothetical protein B0T26DRAFT_813424 [Lasiosphaeria miniovina]|uniref:Uncharacterized protein n=1 Tax=Lasiosphaeria miniovina TaxID=1954250 RepID=A0AA40DRD6_9PEZI|nr:uncharacterized protein B0T26DRAFT_813424 [Lasiosphaeria miniovina]KAK0713374.1 hypothetical protein B0T26DRAFT_813424 [Lasiosphaeria miniovina]